MSLRLRQLLFLLFFISGFSSLVYQVVWTRMAFASFGIITPVLSVVLSVFMLGLAIGSWLGGRMIPVWTARTGTSAIFFYAGAELLIGLGALQVPRLFALGQHLLLTSGEENSFQYLLLSALVLAAAILPWCICMGATFPLMMAYVREQTGSSPQSFSFLYLANVLGAMSGTLLTALVMVELLGFHLTLQTAAIGNCLIAIIAGWQGWRQQRPTSQAREKPIAAPSMELPLPNPARSRQIRAILFATGFCAMAMEVVWTRAFTPVLKTEVYSFALVVFTYLGATFLGSWWYRRDLKKKAPKTIASLMAFLAMVVLLPVVATDPRVVQMSWGFTLHALDFIIVLGSICPFCALLGYLTPALIDEYAAGEPTIAGRAYAINVLGCILGPLIASYVLLPHLNEHWAMALLGAPFFGFYLTSRKLLPGWQRSATGLTAGALAVLALLICHDFEDQVAEQAGRVEVHRDYAATVMAAGSGMGRLLLVNGMGMTSLTPITKFMVHLPMTFHAGKPESVLIICFGMGTCYRSALSWDVPTTVVELIPGVPRAFGFYHADASAVLQNPKGRIVIDDGRRFLERTREKYDIIVIDPPPPIEAAGCSLLFSTEFYDLVKQHLKPGGILQAWIPGGDMATIEAFFGSLYQAFPYVRSFPSIDKWGVHSLACMTPLETLTPAQLAARMPESAKKDLLEWNPGSTATAYMGEVVEHGISVNRLPNQSADFQITDDDPLNEYFLLRRLGFFGRQ